MKQERERWKVSWDYFPTNLFRTLFATPVETSLLCLGNASDTPVIGISPQVVISIMSRQETPGFSQSLN